MFMFMAVSHVWLNPCMMMLQISAKEASLRCRKRSRWLIGLVRDGVAVAGKRSDVTWTVIWAGVFGAMRFVRDLVYVFIIQ